jgi:hypothetical protein
VIVLSGGSFARLDLAPARGTEMPVDLELCTAGWTLHDGHVLAAMRAKRDCPAGGQVAAAEAASSLRHHWWHGFFVSGSAIESADSRSAFCPRHS